MTHPDPKAALEEILGRHKGKQHILSNWPTQLICPFCQCISPCDAARVAKAMLGVVEALKHLSGPPYLWTGCVGMIEGCKDTCSCVSCTAPRGQGRAAQDLGKK